MADKGKVITLDPLKITITLTDENPDFGIVNSRSVASTTWGGGSIETELKEVCKHCKNFKCDMDCSEFGESCTDRDALAVQAVLEDRVGFLAFNAGVDALESLILAHAQAGINVEDERYIEGIKTALEAMGNNT